MQLLGYFSPASILFVDCNSVSVAFSSQVSCPESNLAQLAASMCLSCILLAVDSWIPCFLTYSSEILLSYKSSLPKIKSFQDLIFKINSEFPTPKNYRLIPCVYYQKICLLHLLKSWLMSVFCARVIVIIRKIEDELSYWLGPVLAKFIRIFLNLVVSIHLFACAYWRVKVCITTSGHHHALLSHAIFDSSKFDTTGAETKKLKKKKLKVFDL